MVYPARHHTPDRFAIVASYRADTQAMGIMNEEDDYFLDGAVQSPFSHMKLCECVKGVPNVKMKQCGIYKARRPENYIVIPIN